MRAKIPAPPPAGETARPRPGRPRRRPQGAAAPRSARWETRRAAHGSSPRAAPVRRPTAHRAGRGRAPRRAARDRRPPPPAPARREDAAARARRCACPPRKAPPRPAARAAARRCLRARRGSRSARRQASRRRGARGRGWQNRSAPPERRSKARRRAIRHAAAGGLPAPRSYCVFIQYWRRRGKSSGNGDGKNLHSRNPTKVWLNPGAYSHHFKRDQDHREDNYGVGAEVVVAPQHGFLAGSFINSNRERSAVALQIKMLVW